MANDNIFKQLGRLFRGNVIIRKTDDDFCVIKMSIEKNPPLV